MTTPYVIEVEQRVNEFTAELLRFQDQLLRIRRDNDWQHKSVEDCLGTLSTNIRQLINASESVNSQIDAVREHRQISAPKTNKY